MNWQTFRPGRDVSSVENKSEDYVPLGTFCESLYQLFKKVSFIVSIPNASRNVSHGKKLSTTMLPTRCPDGTSPSSTLWLIASCYAIINPNASSVTVIYD